MLVTVSSFTFAIVWSIAATLFYVIRYKLGRKSHYWLIPILLAVNLVFFGWSIIAVSLILAYDLYHHGKNKETEL